MLPMCWGDKFDMLATDKDVCHLRGGLTDTNPNIASQDKNTMHISFSSSKKMWGLQLVFTATVSLWQNPLHADTYMQPLRSANLEDVVETEGISWCTHKGKGASNPFLQNTGWHSFLFNTKPSWWKTVTLFTALMAAGSTEFLCPRFISYVGKNPTFISSFGRLLRTASRSRNLFYLHTCCWQYQSSPPPSLSLVLVRMRQ